MDYICKIATKEEVEAMFDFHIANSNKKENWIKWKALEVDDMVNNRTINYHGVLDGKTICEATAAIDNKNIQNSEGLIDDKTSYLMAFRTLPEYRGKGYFSILFNFMLNDLKSRGYERVTLGVEPQELINKKIYSHYGFNEFIKTGIEVEPDGNKIEVEYYSKSLL